MLTHVNNFFCGINPKENSQTLYLIISFAEVTEINANHNSGELVFITPMLVIMSHYFDHIYLVVFV